MDQHLGGRGHRARQEIPRILAELRAFDLIQIGQATCRDKDRVGFFGQNIVHVSIAIGAHRDPKPRQFSDTPVDDADHVGTLWRACGQTQLAAQLRRRFQHDNAVTAQGRNARGF